jgi:hypothetical protein
LRNSTQALGTRRARGTCRACTNERIDCTPDEHRRENKHDPDKVAGAFRVRPNPLHPSRVAMTTRRTGTPGPGRSSLLHSHVCTFAYTCRHCCCTRRGGGDPCPPHATDQPFWCLDRDLIAGRAGDRRSTRKWVAPVEAWRPGGGRRQKRGRGGLNGKESLCPVMDASLPPVQHRSEWMVALTCMPLLLRVQCNSETPVRP